jgi:hypothetical protein
MTAGFVDTVLLYLTALGMMILLVLRLRRGDVRWGAAAVLGAVTFVLAVLSQVNDLPAGLYGYDTTQSFPAFILQMLFQIVVGSLSFGAVILLIAAAAEPLYRERFPRFLSLSSVVRPRGCACARPSSACLSA